MTQSDTPPQGATLLLCPVHPGVHSEKLANPQVTWKGENDEPEHPRERVRAQIFYFDCLVEGQTIFATSRNVVHPSIRPLRLESRLQKPTLRKIGIPAGSSHTGKQRV